MFTVHKSKNKMYIVHRCNAYTRIRLYIYIIAISSSRGVYKLMIYTGNWYNVRGFEKNIIIYKILYIDNYLNVQPITFQPL